VSSPDLARVVEALLFASDEPLTLKRLRWILEDYPPAGPESSSNGEEAKRLDAEIEGAVAAVKAKYPQAESPIVVLEVAEGWQLATNPAYAPWVKKLYKDRVSFRLSQAALETLAIVAYRQPITRAEIEEIRGVEVIAALETLIERGLIRVAGRKETVGRPLLYATSPEFLRQFGLRSLADMPVLSASSDAPPVETGARVPEGDTAPEVPAAAPEVATLPNPSAET